MNFLTLLESQWYISDINTVLQQSFEKFSERTNAVLDKKDKLSSDLARDKVKKEQKQRLQNEHNNIYQ